MKSYLTIFLLMTQPLFSQEIKSVKKIAQLTGQASINKTDQVNVYGTDLGSMFLHGDGKIYFLFGDTFGPPGQPASSGHWRSNTMAYTSDFVASDGITFDGWITDNSGKAKALIQGNHNPNDGSGEVTKIPTAGWSIDNRQFMWFMSVKQWGTPGGWDVNYAEIAYSDDNGNTWLRSGTQWSANSNFIQVTVTEHSGYLLFWGIPAGRFGGVSLARVKPSDVLNRTAYEYFNGTDWTTNENVATVIVEQPVGELSVIWNPFLQHWIMMYLNEYTFSIEVRESVQPQGPWRKPTKVVHASNYPALYGAYMHPKYIENNGETVYFLMSQYGPYNVFLMQVVFKRKVNEVIDEPLSEKLKSCILHQNHPNPFNAATTIRFKIPEFSSATLKLYDILGKEVKTLFETDFSQSEYQITFDTDDLPSGIYFYRLIAGSFIKQKKLVLLR